MGLAMSKHGDPVVVLHSGEQWVTQVPYGNSCHICL